MTHRIGKIRELQKFFCSYFHVGFSIDADLMAPLANSDKWLSLEIEFGPLFIAV